MQSHGLTQAPERDQRTACYVYGIVPATVEVDADARGVGDPPGRVRSVRHGEVAALVSEIHVDHPLGMPKDLQTHANLLDAAITEVPVLPLRFGAVMTDEESVVEELLAPYEEEFLNALRELQGRAEYVVKGRYVEDAILRKVLSENSQAARLRDQIRGKPEDATRHERIMLGEIINNAITASRDADTGRLVDAVAPHVAAINLREPTHEEDAVHVAVMVETARLAEFEDALNEVTRDWEGQVDVRLLGPVAPYDFVTAGTPEG